MTDYANSITAFATAGTLLVMLVQWIKNITPKARAFLQFSGEDDWYWVRLEIFPSYEQTVLTSISSNHGKLALSIREVNNAGVYGQYRDHESTSLLEMNELIQSSAFLESNPVFDLFAVRNSQIKKPITFCIRYKVWMFHVRTKTIGKINM